MKRKMMMLLAVFAAAMFLNVQDASAQFLKKLGKIAQQGASVASSLTGATSTETDSVGDSSKLDALLNDSISFTVVKVIETDTEGNPIKNEDGTQKVTYRIIDYNGNVVDAASAKKVVNSRLKQYAIIIGKVGISAGVGALSGGAKGAIAGAGVGAVWAVKNMGQIKKMNKWFKTYKKTIEQYQENVTDEGLPKDASVDLAKIFPDAEEINKSTAQIDAEIKESETELSTKDFDISSFFN